MHKARFLIIYIADSLEFTFNSVRFNQACWKLKQIVFWDFSLSQALHNLRQKNVRCLIVMLQSFSEF
jgi:hypothetical protein